MGILALSFVACEELTGDLSRIIAIEIAGTLQKRVEEGDTLHLAARALDGRGDEVPDATITWATLDVDSGQVGFTLDPTTGEVAGIQPGSGRVQARVETLRSEPITVRVTPAPDSAAAAGNQRLTVPPGDDRSDGLDVIVFDLTTETGQQLPLADTPVRYQVVDAAPGSGAVDGIELVDGDSVPGGDPHRVTVTTGANGIASVVARLVAGEPVPDSVTVDATALTARGVSVNGSPLRYVVVFAITP